MSEALAIDTVDSDGLTEDRASAVQFLTFVLSGENYGVDVLQVEEIRGLSTTTRIPNAPSYLVGVVNLRGAIVPVIDLRLRFGLPAGESSAESVVIVLRAQCLGRVRVTGIVVDAVADVFSTTQTAVGVTPEFGSGVNTEFISGLATAADGMVMVLDVHKLLAHPDLTGAEQETGDE